MTPHPAQTLDTLSALHAAVRQSPDEDTVRLAYADALEEQGTRRVPCPDGCTQVKVGNGDYYVYESAGPSSKWVLCPTCSGAGSVADAEPAERAEFVRIQVELARAGHTCDPDCGGKNRRADKCGSYVDTNNRPVPCKDCWSEHRRREKELLGRHAAAWSRFPCPECKSVGTRFVDDGGVRSIEECPECSGSGSLFHGLAVTFRRGFPHRLTSQKLSDWVELETLGGGSIRVAMGYRPTPLLSACLRHTTAREFASVDVEPGTHPDGGFIWLRPDSGWALFQPLAAIPQPVRDLMPSTRFASSSAAVTALAGAVGRFGLRHLNAEELPT